jgi:hypothetical protein
MVTKDRVQVLAESALPNAPIVLDPPRPHRLNTARSSVSRGLHAVATAIAPKAEPAC